MSRQKIRCWIFDIGIIIIQDYPDGDIFGVCGINQLMILYKFPASMSIDYHAMNATVQKVNAGQETNCSVTFVFIIS